MYIRIYGLLFLSIFLIAGCGKKETDQSLQTQDTENQYTQINHSNMDKDLDNHQLATHLANIANDVPNVNNATAIVAGPYAVVGIDVDKHLDRSRVGTIKYSVAEALQHDPYGKTAVVIADGDISERIRLMSMKMSDGYPIKGVVDELSAIVGRYMPELPINEDKPSTPDQNKEILPEKDKEQLDQIEEDQSHED